MRDPLLFFALEPSHDARFLFAVIARALITGAIAASATAGALVGFGIRAGTPARAFNAIASFVLGDRARGVWGWVSTVTLTGIAVHVAIMVGWGVLFAFLAGRMRGWQFAATAAGVALGAWAVTRFVVLHRVGPTVAEVLGPGQLLGLHLVLAVSLAVGMRFAFDAGRVEEKWDVEPPEAP